MAYKRRHNLMSSTLELFRAMGIKAWVHEGNVRHNAEPEIRDEIRANLERVKEGAGVRKSAAYFGAVLLTAMDRGDFTREDIKKLDPLGKGNATYILEKLEEGNDD